MRIDFYYTNKRINSMTRPDIDENQTVVTTFTDFHLKDATDLNQPVFVIVSGNLPETNYCILSGTGATSERPDKYYYFVNKIEQYRKTVWHVYCTIDALATWRSSILSQSAFVVRSTSHFNPYLNDGLMQGNGAFPQRNVHASINTDFAGMNGGTFVFAVAASGDSVAGSGALAGMSYYACTKEGLENICTTLFQAGTVAQLTQAFGSVSSCLGGLWWIPLKIDSVAGTWVTSIFVGPAQIQNLGSGNVARINRHYYTNSRTVACNLTHYGDFRDLPPYRTYYAKLPFVGVVDIDDATMGERNRANGGSVSINITEMIDFLSGIYTCRLYADGYHLGTFTASAKVDLPLCSFSTNMAGMIGGALAKVGEVLNPQLTNKQSRMNIAFNENTRAKSAVASLFRGESGGAVGDALSNVNHMVGGTMSIQGGYGGTTTIAADPELRIYERYQTTQVEPSSIAALAGRPYGGALSLGSLSGYVLTSGFHCQGKMTTEEKQIIEAAFNGSGVFI